MPTCIIIAGPTAVGKTSLAIEVAKAFNTSIISADSRQCYRELTIGVAKPAPEQLQSVKHYFINSNSIHEEVNAAVFEQFALTALHEIFQHHPVAVVVGGTGLYIKALCEGMDAIPVVSPDTRDEIRTMYEKHGLSWLQQQISAHGLLPLHANELQNPQRLMRSLEVMLCTGRSIRSFQTAEKKARDFNITTIALQLPRNELYQNINNRVDKMITLGLADEVNTLLPYKHLNALNTVGYKEMFDFFERKISFEEAVEEIKKNTRHYAKRQMTWFSRDPSIRWIAPGSPSDTIQYLRTVTALSNNPPHHRP